MIFIVRNESFICEKCGHKNPPSAKTCRNHCRKCLYSKHVDIFPGDRKNPCQGFLKPIDIEIKAGQLHAIIFQCMKCKKISRNLIAIDDDRDEIYKIMENKNIQL